MDRSVRPSAMLHPVHDLDTDINMAELSELKIVAHLVFWLTEAAREVHRLRVMICIVITVLA
jgi:hypothetical protein